MNYFYCNPPVVTKIINNTVVLYEIINRNSKHNVMNERLLPRIDCHT